LTGRPLSVLLTHEHYLPDMRGGGEYVVHRTASALQARGMRVRVLTTGDPAITNHEGVATEVSAQPGARTDWPDSVMRTA